jgi:hypothetical protein
LVFHQRQLGKIGTPDISNILFVQLNGTTGHRTPKSDSDSDSGTFFPEKVQGPVDGSNQVRVSLPRHLPDGRLADEDEEDEEPADHVQTSKDAKRHLEIKKIMEVKK